MKHLIFFSRFSLLAKPGRGWKIAQEGDDSEYIKKVFDLKRLELRLWTLENIALKSFARSVNIARKNKCDFQCSFNILTSSELPEPIQHRLEEIADRFEANVHYLPRVTGYPSDFQERITKKIIKNNNKLAEEKPEKGVVFATINLDDDDAISDRLITKLEKYVDEKYLGMALSFPLGFVGHFSSSTFEYTSLKEFYHPKINIAPAYINLYNPDSNEFFNSDWPVLYSLGGHLTADEKVPVIVDSSFPAYIYTMHGFNDQMVADKKADNQWAHYLPNASFKKLILFSDIGSYPISADFLEKSRVRDTSKITNSIRQMKHGTIRQLLERIDKMKNK